MLKVKASPTYATVNKKRPSEAINNITLLISAPSLCIHRRCVHILEMKLGINRRWGLHKCALTKTSLLEGRDNNPFVWRSNCEGQIPSNHSGNRKMSRCFKAPASFIRCLKGSLLTATVVCSSRELLACQQTSVGIVRVGPILSSAFQESCSTLVSLNWCDMTSPNTHDRAGCKSIYKVALYTHEWL